MQLLVYAPPPNQTLGILLEALHKPELSFQSEHIISLEALKRRLCRPLAGASIGILMPSNYGELSALTNFRHLLRNIRIILVLPDTNAETLATAHFLRPRFIGYCNGDLSDVVAVAAKMASAHNTMPPRGTRLTPKSSTCQPTSLLG